MAHYLAVLTLVCIWQCGAAQTISPANTTCDQLPRLPIDSIEDYIIHGPFTFDFSIFFPHCTKQMVSLFPEGTGTGLESGITTFILGASASVFLFNVVNEDSLVLTSCHSGRNKTFFFAFAEESSTGASYCVYSCNGPALDDFTCASTNRAEFLDLEREAVEVARTVPNGDKIRELQDNCLNGQCRFF